MVSKDKLKKWDSISWNEMKRNKKLQKEYRKDFGLDYFDENEKIYNPDVQHNQNVFIPQDADINAFRGNLLSDILNEKVTRNFDKSFLGLDGMERAVIIAKLTGYSFPDIVKKSGIELNEVKKSFDTGMKKLVEYGRDKCADCLFKRSDKCSIWKVKVKKHFHCWLYKRK